MSSFSKQLACGPKDLRAGNCRLLSGACQKEGSANHSSYTAAMMDGWSPNLILQASVVIPSIAGVSPFVDLVSRPSYYVHPRLESLAICSVKTSRTTASSRSSAAVAWVWFIKRKTLNSGALSL